MFRKRALDIYLLGILPLTLISLMLYHSTDAAGIGIAKVTWTNPAANPDGTPLSGLIGINVYKGTKADGSDLALVTQLKNTILPVSWTDSGLSPGQVCYAVSVQAAVEGARSAVACAMIAAPPEIAPAPTSVKIATQ